MGESLSGPDSESESGVNSRLIGPRSSSSAEFPVAFAFVFPFADDGRRHLRLESESDSFLTYLRELSEPNSESEPGSCFMTRSSGMGSEPWR